MTGVGTPEPEGHGHGASGRLAGRVALISGGAGGVGEAASRLFAAEGARVVVVDRQAEVGEALAAELRAGGAQVMFARADVSLACEVEAAVQSGLDEIGRAHV